ncbi:NDP-hexose 2,3-dehydratase family protein [Streptomyces sp. XM4193]|uniref:NDP-hexose 2,3-dehydratase family protein n=1 Tax=Streptomyces sp. XM4193 TaxID=2929782 RepID=UPI001FF6FE45|nr:NDP-hexose 2,3-dehydratase family protein [Streptomyces sp. XM4193]MCK1798585.1 NDP-hexose 2,3-dehydratase family protein [Streptomyces sp. XM4193]
MSPGRVPRPRAAAGPDAAIARSLAAVDPSTGARCPTGEVTDWLAERRRARAARVRRIPFAELEGWTFHKETGDLVHRSGRFFTVEGLRRPETDAPRTDGAGARWEQPIMVQPDVGVLGMLAREFDGVLHFLTYAKTEPGNPGLVQLSPTVQATRSNYQRVHGGSPVPFLDHFLLPGRGRPLVDTLQSEHGEWFLHKSNRNVVVETDEHVAEDPAAAPDHRWLTLGQLGTLLRRDNVVNMDTRTVLACLPTPAEEPRALHTDVEVQSWLTRERARRRVRVESVPLEGIRGWVREAECIRHVEDRGFRVIAAAVEAEGREVGGWTQPLFEPLARSVSAFLVRHFDGTPHLLAQARPEDGLLHTVEVAPTVQYAPDGHGQLPRYAELVETADSRDVLYTAVHSEEGGRFLNAESRCRFVSVDGLGDPELLDPPPEYTWITPGQLGGLVRAGHQVAVQARSLLAVLNSGAVTLS